MPFIDDAAIVARALDRYRIESAARTQPVLRQPRMAEVFAELGLEKLANEGGLTGARLESFLETYLASTTHLHHPGYMGHQVAVPHPSGALGAFVDGFTNNAMAIYEMGPAAASIEYFVINWLLGHVGWVPSPLPGEPEPAAMAGGGVLTHGGSLANLTALVAARSRLVPDVWSHGAPGDLALIAPAACHYSIARAAGILGIGRNAVYAAEVDRRGVVIPERLPACLQRATHDGRRVVAVVANACSTAVGLYDPLREIGAFCRARGLWFHVDGAHGAGALLSPSHRQLLDGLELADSLVWDAHKMLRAPTLCAAVLVRDRRTLDTAFQQEASYLFHEKVQPGFDFMPRAVECTKAGLGLRLFAVIGAMGTRGLSAYVDRQYALARQAWELLREAPGVECAVEPEANILCFRMAGDDAEQLRLRGALIAEGSFYLTTTGFDGRRWLRLVFVNPDTSISDVQRLRDRLHALRG